MKDNYDDMWHEEEKVGYGGVGIIIWGASSSENIIRKNNVINNDRWGIFVGADSKTDFPWTIIAENYLKGNGYYRHIEPGDWNWLGIGVMWADGPIFIVFNEIWINKKAVGNAIWIHESKLVFKFGNIIVLVYSIPANTGWWIRLETLSPATATANEVCEIQISVDV